MKDRMVTLHDGRQVDSWSEAWRHECEAQHILAMPTLQDRRNFLYGYEKPDGKKFQGVLGMRGAGEVKRLEKTMLAIWEQRRAKPSQ